jgi:hypothetical protein
MSDETNNEGHEVKMYFRSSKKPRERGAIVLTESGNIEVRPSEEFLDELARLEAEACDRSRLISAKVGGSILFLGFIVVAAGWLVGRIGGKLRNRITSPRPVDAVTMFADVTGGFHLNLPDKFGRTIDLNWGQGEINPREAGELLKAARKYRTNPEDKPVFR